MSPARFPYRLASGRRLADADLPRHIADLVRLVLLTSPGERLHQPEFGAGLGAAALFEPLQSSLLGVVELRARASLDRALGDRIRVVDVQVRAGGESTVVAEVTYALRSTGEQASVEVLGGTP